jgi:phage-related tail protein
MIGAIQGWASGTNYAPGGLSVVGERGPEIMNIPRGAQIIPNDILRQLSEMNFSKLNTASPSINLNIQVTGNTTLDGQIVARSVFKHIDKEVRLAYGN